MTKVAVLTSDKPRHVYFANVLEKRFDVIFRVHEEKGNYLAGDKPVTEDFKLHFENLRQQELMVFSQDSNIKKGNINHICAGQINDTGILQEVVEAKPDFICLFGTAILSKKWLSQFRNRIVNLHLGCSPRYRGSGTLFWPFFNGELEHLGSTVHLATENVDGGPILEVIRPNIDPRQGYYAVSNRIIKSCIDEFPRVLEDFVFGKLTPKNQIKDDQKYLYYKKDFTSEALKKVLDQYGV
jgi:folate-dependent phosphoribosylglycinamide formyltransferase PurN